MKRIAFAVAFLMTSVTFVANAQQPVAYAAKPLTPLPPGTTAILSWNEISFDFGRIAYQVPAIHTFRFSNNGTTPLVIQSVKASCGCTVTEYSKDPVPPGGLGFVKATYKAASKGIFSKTITLVTNTSKEPVQLTIRGEVIE